MKAKFRGTVEELNERLSALELGNQWRRHPNGFWKLTCPDGARVLFAPTTGSVWCEGSPCERRGLEQRLAELFGSSSRVKRRSHSRAQREAQSRDADYEVRSSKNRSVRSAALLAPTDVPW